jgi:hypothetical protein
VDNPSQFDDQTIETVQRNFYVDDCLKSVREEDKAIKLAKDLCELLALGGFKLTKWLSNLQKVIESLPESERAAQVKDLNFDKTPIERALSVRWNVSSATFGFAIVIKDRPATRRGILSIVSSVYDPLGFVAPYILSAKLILQDLCCLKLDWDDKIPDKFLKRWQAWRNDLPQLEDLAIERCFKTATMKEINATPPFFGRLTVTTRLWGSFLHQSRRRFGKCQVFIRYGEIQTCTHKTGDDTTNGTISSCRVNETR